MERKLCNLRRQQPTQINTPSSAPAFYQKLENMTNVVLTSEEEYLLSKGLKHNPITIVRKEDLRDLALSTEAVLPNDNEGKTLKTLCADVLQSQLRDVCKETRDSGPQRGLQKKLRREEVVFLKADKGLDHISASNLLDVLDNGVVLCHLASVIHEKADEAIRNGSAKGSVPKIKGPFFEKASRRSFFSRDNIDKFITFCKQLGVHENLLFETNDLVQQNQPRNVLLCLMEVARTASRFNVEPPGLVVLEKEIAEQESREMASWENSHPLLKHSSSDNRIVYIQEGGCGVGESLRRASSERIPPDGNRSDTTEDDWSRGSIEDSSELDGSNCVLNDLDLKVKSVARVAQKQCQCIGHRCEKLRVKKVGEGKYNIAGRNVFVRLLKGRHMMVRVGGGWDTLEHFLQRHDPCQARVVSRPSTPATSGKSPRPYSALQSYDAHTPSHTPHSLAR